MYYKDMDQGPRSAKVTQMNFNLEELSQNDRYKLLTALVIPRPIAWVSTVNESGGVNLAPYSFFNVLGNRPAVVALGPGYRVDGERKDTQRNIERVGAFVINMVDRTLAEQMHACAAAFPSTVSEASALGIEMVATPGMEVPGVAGSKVRLWCEHERTIEIGENQIVFGLVKQMFVADGIVDAATFKVKQGVYQSVGRLQGPGRYCTTDDQFDLGPFPSVPK